MSFSSVQQNTKNLNPHFFTVEQRLHMFLRHFFKLSFHLDGHINKFTNYQNELAGKSEVHNRRGHIRFRRHLVHRFLIRPLWERPLCSLSTSWLIMTHSHITRHAIFQCQSNLGKNRRPPLDPTDHKPSQ